MTSNEDLGFDAADLADVAAAFSRGHVWVVGDLMRDVYIRGDARRVSPEAPVPVVHVRDEGASLGGAANVARGVRALGGAATLCGVVGDDDAGGDVIALAMAGGLGGDAIIRVPSRPTTEKVRIFAHDQQVVRFDRELAAPVPAATEDALLAALRRAPAPDVIIVSDYAKGVVTPPVFAGLVELAAAHGAPLVVDPKSRRFADYAGATALTPNLLELCAATGREVDPRDDAALAAAAASAAADAGVSWLLTTLGPDGMAVWRRDAPLVRVLATARRVFDVTGAGDTVIATLALGLAAGLAPDRAAALANRAAGLAVERLGAVPIGLDELFAHLAPDDTAPGVIDRDQLAQWVAWWRLRGRRVVFTNGCFDLLHAGHLSLLEQAARLGDVLVVGMNSDASVRRLKGPERPLVAQEDRARLLAALDAVGAVVLFDEDTPLELIRAIRPEVLVKGADYTVERVVGGREVQAWGGEVKLVELVQARSTTGLVERIRRGGEPT